MGLNVLLRTLLIFALALTVGQPVNAACVDQECAGENSWIDIRGALPIGQSFTPSESEHVGIALRLQSRTNSPHLSLTVLLHENDIDGPVVPGSSVTTVPPSGHWTDWVPFAFQWPVALTPGSTYVVEVICNTDDLSWVGDQNNSYAGGHGFKDGDPWGGDFNFRTWVICDEYLQASLICRPSTGTLPLPVRIDVTLENLYGGLVRKYAAQIDVALAGGTVFANWRSGYLNLHAGWQFTEKWIQTLPMLGALEGETIFTLIAEDVTPAPYNQPPYRPSGDTDTDSCIVTGMAP